MVVWGIWDRASRQMERLAGVKSLETMHGTALTFALLEF